MKTIRRLLCLLIGIALLYLLFLPLPFGPMAAWNPPAPPAPVGPYAPNTLLSRVDRLDLGEFAPEDIALDAAGNIYGGTIHGKIIRLDPSGKNPQVFADTSGRPLGLVFDKDGTLLVCDSVKGLLRISADGKTITSLATEAEGVPFRCTNDLDVAADGTIYFTDSSYKYPIELFLFNLVEHQPYGRFMSYDPKTKAVKVLASNLYFSNGVAVSPDQSYVLFVETASYKVSRYWLAGPKKGQLEVFIDDLPGIPDGILGNGKGQYWLTLVTPRSTTFDSLLAHPLLRKMFLRLPASLRPKDQDFAYVMEVDGDGKVLATLQDSSPNAFIKITNAVERDGNLYLGNIGASSIGRAALPK
jgi:sugar lactone lactonase YvrE